MPLVDKRPGGVHLSDEVQELRARVDVLPPELLARGMTMNEISDLAREVRLKLSQEELVLKFAMG